MDLFRQGDVLLARVSTPLAPTAVRVEPQGGRVILALGEATGHAHAVDAACAVLYRTPEGELLEVRSRTAVVHEEHAAIPLPPGLYRLVHQREYRPDEAQRITLVRD